MMKNRIQQLILGILFLWFFAPGSALAALDLIDVKTSPPTPKPNEQVTITLKSYAIDLGSADIIWYVNKEAKKEGIGEKSFILQSGNLGEETIVDVLIATGDGLKFKKHIVISPGEVDILWEAQTYTPPFYRGKALPTYNSLVKVVALPRFNTTSSPKDFHYEWKLNRNQNAGDGIGKNSVLMRATWPDSVVNVGVTASLLGTSMSGENNIDVPTLKPVLVFYENAPLLGVRFDQALTNLTETTASQFTLLAVPYFFSRDDYENNNLLYSWDINRTPSTPSRNPESLVLVKSGTAAESMNILLNVQNPKRVIQSALLQTTVSFAGE